MFKNHVVYVVNDGELVFAANLTYHADLTDKQVKAKAAQKLQRHPDSVVLGDYTLVEVR